MQQVELEKSARWFAGVGCVFAEDFIRKHVGADRMKAIDLTGAYVYRAEKPMPCIFVSFGAGGSWIPGAPITKHITINRTEAESHRMGTFMNQIDPENKYKVRTWYFHVDLYEAVVVRRPTDEEIAKLQLKYRDDKKAGMLPRNRRPSAATTPEADRLQKELRALDRRRYTDAGILPPSERTKDASYLSVIKGEPRKIPSLAKHKLDAYHSDTSDDEQKPWNWVPAEDVEEVEEEAETCSVVGEDDGPELGHDDGCIFEDKEDPTAPAPKRSRQSSASGKSGKTTLERALIAMQARSRQIRQRL